MSRFLKKENQKTAFGELSVAELTPVIQVQFPYNINTDIWEIRTNGGSASVIDNKANLSTGAGANQSATILTRTPVKYNPGQGAVIRFTALYTPGVVNSTQWVGIGSEGDGFFFGYSGSTFGILRRREGAPETRKLQITVGSTTDENITITLNNVAETTVAVTNTGDATLTANEIAAHDFSNVGEGWEVHNMGANIFFTSFASSSKTGTYSLAGTAPIAGTFSQSLAGEAPTETFIPQSSWGEDVMDGTGISGITLDKTKGNVFQIQYQWLGFGAINFYIENPITGALMCVHRIPFSNANTKTSICNPTLPLCIIAKNSSNTSDIVVQVGSMGGFVEGRDSLFGLPHSIDVQSAGITTTETPVMTIHSHDIYQGVVNRVRTRFTVGTVSVDGSKPATIRIRKNAVLTGASFSPLDSNKSIIHVDTSATAVTGGDVLFSKTVAKVDSTIIDMEKLGIDLIAPDFLTLTIQAFSTTTDTVSSLNWLELF